MLFQTHKKQYVGLTGEDRVVDKGLVNKKNNQLAYFNEVITYLVDQKVLEIVQEAYQKLDDKVIRNRDLQYIYVKLAYSGTASKPSKPLYRRLRRSPIGSRTTTSDLMSKNPGEINVPLIIPRPNQI